MVFCLRDKNMTTIMKRCKMNQKCLSDDQIKKTKADILKVLSTISRPGIDILIKHLKTSDFFFAPASTRFHAAYPGGLAEHSWNVYSIFKQKVEAYRLDIPDESVVICGLLHDVCKINLYVRGKRNVKEDGKWIEKEVWEYRDQLPLGHGEKSVFILQQYFPLTEIEALTIRWHMGFSEPKDLWRSLEEANNKHPTVMTLFISDLEAAYLAETRK